MARHIDRYNFCLQKGDEFAQTLELCLRQLNNNEIKLSILQRYAKKCQEYTQACNQWIIECQKHLTECEDSQCIKACLNFISQGERSVKKCQESLLQCLQQNKFKQAFSQSIKICQNLVESRAIYTSKCCYFFVNY